MLSPTTIALVISLTALSGLGLLPAKAGASPAAGLELQDFDPSPWIADGRELLLRAPDPAIDRLFQAVRITAADPREGQLVCSLFDPAAERDLASLNRIANQLGPEHSQRFATAVANLLLAAMQSSPQPYDEPAARQALKAAGVRAALMNDGFVAGLNGEDHTARCRSIGWLMDDLAAQPLTRRAAVVRLLLGEGLGYLALAPQAGASGDAMP